MKQEASAFDNVLLFHIFFSKCCIVFLQESADNTGFPDAGSSEKSEKCKTLSVRYELLIKIRLFVA